MTLKELLELKLRLAKEGMEENLHNKKFYDWYEGQTLPLASLLAYLSPKTLHMEVEFRTEVKV